MTIERALRIAFFGSDKLSRQSLHRLRELRHQQPSLISSLTVVTRSIKPTGRNLKNFVDVPIGEYAQQHQLPVLRADSLEEILRLLNHESFDLAVAVSYGKLIPGAFISSLKYGGINVHPSLLPMYRGSSPIQYALKDDLKETGVSLQTLHPSKFDHGTVILQSEPIPISEDDNFDSLAERLGAVGANLLASAIVDGSFIEPIKPIQTLYKPSLAPKIRSSESQIKWSLLSARQIKRLNDAMGPLYTYKKVDIKKKRQNVHELHKVILDKISISDSFDNLREPGEFIHDTDTNSLVIKTLDGAVKVQKLKFQYCGEEDSKTFTQRLTKRAGPTPNIFVYSPPHH